MQRCSGTNTRSTTQVLSDPVLQRKGVPLLLVCNKTDEGAKAHTTDFVRKRLEKEGDLDQIAARIREDKTLDLLKAAARIEAA